jgi:hypothetical protein
MKKKYRVCMVGPARGSTVNMIFPFEPNGDTVLDHDTIEDAEMTCYDLTTVALPGVVLTIIPVYYKN